jgi:hypothetical protein
MALFCKIYFDLHKDIYAFTYMVFEETLYWRFSIFVF